MNQGLITQALLQTRPRKNGFDWAGHLAFVNSLFAGLPERWGAYYDVAAPGGALQPNGSHASKQGDPIQSIPNLVKNAQIGDLVFSLEETRALLGSGVPDHDTTAILDYSILHNDGKNYPNLPMSRADRDLWVDTGDSNNEQINMIRTASLFVPTAVPPAPEMDNGACMVTVFSMLFREMAKFMDTNLEEDLDGLVDTDIPPFARGKPGVLIYNFLANGERQVFFNGQPADVELGDQAQGLDLTTEAEKVLQELSAMWGMICMGGQKIMLLPRALSPTEIPEVSRRFLNAMEPARV